MDLPIFRINRHTLCSKSCTHPFFHPSLPWNHWECREDLYIWIWIMWSTGGKGSEHSFFVWNSLDRHTHAGTDSGMCSVTETSIHTAAWELWTALSTWEWLRESSSGELNVCANKVTGWAGLYKALCALEHAFTTCRSVSLKAAKLLDWHSYSAGWIVTSWKIPFKCQTRTWIISKHLQQAQHNSFWNLAHT